VLDYRSYPKNETRVSGFWTTLYIMHYISTKYSIV